MVTGNRMFAGGVTNPNAIDEVESPGFFDNISSFFSDIKSPSIPKADQIVGTKESRGASALGKMFSGKKGDILAQSLMDLQKRDALQPVLETEALFKAFGRGGNLAETAEKGAIGSDPLADFREADFIQKKLDRQKKIEDAIISKIRGK